MLKTVLLVLGALALYLLFAVKMGWLILLCILAIILVIRHYTWGRIVNMSDEQYNREMRWMKAELQEDEDKERRLDEEYRNRAMLAMGSSEPVAASHRTSKSRSAKGGPGKESPPSQPSAVSYAEAVPSNGACACCGQAFIEATRVSPSPGAVWAGPLERFASAGVCPKCYNDYGIIQGFERLPNEAEMKAAAEDALAKASSSSAAYEVVRQARQRWPEIVAAAARKATEFESRETALAAVANGQTVAELEALAAAHRASGATDLEEAALERMEGVQAETESIARLKLLVGQTVFPKHAQMLAKLSESMRSSPAAGSRPPSLPGQWDSLLADIDTRLEVLLKKEKAGRNEGSCTGCRCMLGRYEASSNVCGKCTQKARDFEAALKEVQDPRGQGQRGAQKGTPPGEAPVDGKALLDAATDLVHEADERWGSPGERRGISGRELDERFRKEFLPRYESALGCLGRIPRDDPMVVDESRKRRAGYETDIGLASLSVLLSFRRRVEEMTAQDRARARELRESGREWLQKAATVLKSDHGVWYNLGTFAEMSGDSEAALDAYRTALQLCTNASFTSTIREALADVESGDLHRFPEA